MKQNNLSKNEILLSELKEQEEKFDSSKKAIEDLKKKYAETASRSKKESLKIDIAAAEKEYKVACFDCKEVITDILKRQNWKHWLDIFIENKYKNSQKDWIFSEKCELNGIRRTDASKIRNGVQTVRYYHAVIFAFILELHILTAERWLNLLGFTFDVPDDFINIIRCRIEKGEYYLDERDIEMLKDWGKPRLTGTFF